MPDIRILTESELRSQVQLDLGAIECVENAFEALATKAVVMPPIMRLDIIENNGEIDVKTAYIPGVDSLAIKISPGFFDNPSLGLPSVNGLMVLFSTRTGMVEGLLLDNGYLTDIRTAAAGAVAAKYLARADSRRAAILGAGVQAGLQLEALTLVRDIDSAAIWARDFDKADAAAKKLSTRLGMEVTACADVASATANADIIVTTTPSTRPILMAQHVTSGQHVTAMGSDSEHKNEIDPEIVARTAQYFCDRLSQVRVLGELHHAIEKQLVAPSAEFPELGQVIAQQLPGRRDSTDITLCDLTGTGIQDTAIATLAFHRCQQHQAGTSIVT
ncbi:MAG: cyclodeaminase [Gammaproteobacteria bacterium]|nr:cyclodeaminase [Gammaproteobacteria bacterium]MDH3447622.1 cyclodeaminase [Gammaproteobacteria bacterium]